MLSSPDINAARQYSVRDIARVMTVFVLFVLLFDSVGLRNWANDLDVGASRNFLLGMLDPLKTKTSKMGLNYPRSILRAAFYGLMGKHLEAGFLAADETGQSKTGESDGAISVLEVGGSPDQEDWRLGEGEAHSAENPLQMLLIGDSMMGDGLGTMLLRVADDDPAIAADRHFKVSSGMSRPDFYNWPAQLDELFAAGDYDAVVVMMGTNDAQNFQIGDIVYDFRTDAWSQIYRDRVRVFLDKLCAHSEHVYWIGEPPMRSAGFNDRMQYLNQLVQDACGSHPRARYISTIPILGDSNGNYSTSLTVNGKAIQARNDGDGIHLTRAGGQLVADRIFELIRQDFIFAEDEESGPEQ